MVAASRSQIKFYTVAYGLILLMTAAVFSFKDKEIILPELAALSIGCFIYKKSMDCQALHLFLLPSVTASIGFCCVLAKAGLYGTFNYMPEQRHENKESLQLTNHQCECKS